MPNRQEIQEKIDEIREAPGFSTIKSDLVTQITVWLEGLDISETDKEKILSDLESYEGV